MSASIGTLGEKVPDTPIVSVFDTDDRPPAVARVAEFFSRHSLWSLFGRNPIATSCRDAANNRRRLGKVGIPLDDELKSYLAVFTERNGLRRYVAVHCRGSQELDLGKVAGTLDCVGGVARLERNEIVRENPGNTGEVQDVSRDDDIYGLVNPFLLADGLNGTSVLQLFDTAVLASTGLPNTMMTNAGDRTWSVEFRPAELIKALGDAARVVDVTTTAPSRQDRVVSIGIVTGNAPDSGILLWQSINRRVQERMGAKFQGDLSYPPVSVRSVPGLGLSMELDSRSEQVWEHLEPAIVSLCDEGVGLLGLACHTNHFFTERIRKIADPKGVSFVSVAEVVDAWVRANRTAELTLAGISYVSELGEWSAYRDLQKAARVEPLSQKGLERIHQLWLSGQTKGGNRVWAKPVAVNLER